MENEGRKKRKLKVFASYYKDHMTLFWLDMISAVLIAGVDLAFPMMTRYSIQSLLPEMKYKEFFIVIGILVGFYIIRTVMTYVITYLGHYMGVLIEKDMRRDIFTHIQKLSFSYYDNIRTGSLMSRLTTDLFEITELAHHGPEDLLISFVILIGSFIYLMYISPLLTIIVFVMIPLIIIFVSDQEKKLESASEKSKDEMAGINSAIESSISGIRVTKAFTNEHHEINKFSKGNERFVSARKAYYKRMSVFDSGMQFMLNILLVIVLLFGGLLIMKGQMTVVDLITYNLYVSSFRTPIFRLMGFMERFTDGMAGFGRMQDIMDIEPEIEDRPGAAELKDVKGSIEFSNVTFSYGSNENVLTDVSFKIEQGRKAALVGPSGGGKSTICQLIPRFYETNAGSIKIDGTDIRDVTMSSLRRNIGIVQQDVFLFADTIKNNIRYGSLDATDEEVEQAARSAEIHDFIMTLDDGYDSYVGERGVLLSGGQKQRLSIARIFLKNPPILILDEATSSLDTETEIKIQSSLDRLAAGRTSIVVAHRLSTIRDADEIIVVTDDEIAESGTHEELIAKENGVYRNLYEIQYRFAMK